MTALETAAGGVATLDERISFELPDGELRFGEGDLDAWAEHLVWCYSLLGVGEGATIAVQDFGTSPLAYLSSKLLMPTLEAGVAERLGARIICLDASPERIVLTPEVVRQVKPDVLVVRAEVLGLLLDGSKRAGVDLTTVGGMTIVAAIGMDAPPLPPGDWRRLLHAESSLLLAPECTLCGSYHLRHDVYSAADGRIENLLHPAAAPCAAPRMRPTGESCALGPDDLLFELAGAGDRGRS
ncbi:MAG: hypothetical protein JJE27_08700 [Thermoleophilia bacterium]|nr:hypothetical protein [Thermoleophilia bacterium]